MPSIYVTLISSDDHEFIVLREAAYVAGTIKRMLDPQSECRQWFPTIVYWAFLSWAESSRIPFFSQVISLKVSAEDANWAQSSMVFFPSHQVCY